MNICNANLIVDSKTQVPELRRVAGFGRTGRHWEAPAGTQELFASQGKTPGLLFIYFWHEQSILTLLN